MKNRILLILLILISLSSFVFASITDGNKPYWSGDNTDQNITLKGTVFGTSGFYDGAIELSGVQGANPANDYVDVGNALSAMTANTGTIMGRFYPTDNSENGMFWAVTDESANTFIILNYRGSTSDFAIIARDNTVDKWSATSDWTNITINDWYHVALIHDGVEASLKIDGNDVPLTFTVTTDKTVWIDDIAGLDTFDYGANRILASSPANGFDGKFDDLRAYAEVVSDGNIASIINDEDFTTGTEVFHSNMNFGYDFSSNSIYPAFTDGTIINTAGYFDSCYDLEVADEISYTQSTFTDHSYGFFFKWDDDTTSFQKMFGRVSSTPFIYMELIDTDTINVRNGDVHQVNGLTIDENWHHFVYSQSGFVGQMFYDGVSVGNFTHSNSGLPADTYYFGSRGVDGYGGLMDEIFLYNRSINVSEVNELIAGNPYGVPVGPGNFTITVSNVNNFSAIINGSNFNGTLNTTTGSITTGILQNDSSLYNISILASGFFDKDFDNYNVSSNLVTSLVPAQSFNVTFNDFVDYNGSNYTRTLQLDYLFYVCPSSNIVNTFIDGVKYDNLSFTLNCSSSSDVLVTKNYTHSSEGLFNVSFNGTYISGVDIESFNVTGGSFVSDLVDPVTNGSFVIGDGFVSSKDINISLICLDNITPTLNYSIKYNNNSIFFGNLSNGTLQENTTTLTDGAIELYFECFDFFGSTNSTVSDVAYSNTLVLIDEVDNVLFDVSNVSSARVYFDDNSSFYDFKVEGSNSVNFTSLDQDKLRFELIYSDSTVITRFVDVSLAFNGDIRVCANKEGVTHFEQLVISSTDTRPVIIQNIFSNCVIAQDYTRFAYQDAFVLKAFTISSLYSLFTLDQRNIQLFLASLDGSLSSFINLDTLEFSQTPYNLNILGDGLSFSKSGDTEVTIFYDNLNDDNTALIANIYRLDTNQLVFTENEFSDPNEFVILFDYSTLSNVTVDTLFKIELIKTNSEGDVTINRYFNINAKTGLLRSEVAFMISFSLIFIGLTFVITRTAFSWFGILVSIASIGVASVGVSVWYIVFLQTMEVITLVYIIILTVNQNSPQLA